MLTPVPMGSPLNSKSAVSRVPRAGAGEPVATSNGAIHLIIGHFLLMAATISICWAILLPPAGFTLQDAEDARNIGFGAGVLALVAALAGRFRPALSPYMAPLFAVSGGVFMAGLSIAAEARFPGIAIQTIIVSASVFIIMLCVYLLRLIKLTEQLKMAILSATGAVAMIYLGSFIALALGYRLPVIHGAGTGAVLWFGFIAGLAALNLLIDFQRVEKLDKANLSKLAEWHATLAMLTTFLWMYLSILRLIRNLRR